MVDGTCAGAAGTQGKPAPVTKTPQPSLSDLVALFLQQALSNGELHFGLWSDEPLRLADFIA